MKKKGQITLFIILGVVILISMASFFYIRYNITTRNLEAESTNVGEFNTRFDPINQYITGCLKEISEEGLKKIGLSGGYIDIPTGIGIQNISYWYYDGMNLQPFLHLIEDRLNTYINTNLSTCINLDLFTDRGFFIEYFIPKASSTIRNQSVSVTLEFPVTAKIAGTTKNFNKFNTNLRIDFMEFYIVAQDINGMMMNPFFDRNTPTTGMGINI